MKEEVIINGEHAIKPFYYVRSGLLHVRYTVDRAISLSDTESESIKKDLGAAGPEKKQSVLADNWNLLERFVQKPIIMDGISEIQKRYKTHKEGKND